MTHRRRIIGGGLLAMALFSLPGCSLFESALYELQPHRLHQWNRTDALGGGSEAYFSVDDPISPPHTCTTTSWQQSADSKRHTDR